MIRHCTACRFFYFSQGEHGYSEMTPGSEASIDCTKSVWSLDFYENDQQDMFEALNTALECKHFELANYARQSGRREGGGR